MRFILLIIACAVLIGCQPGNFDVLPIDPPRLVVQAEAAEGDPWTVYLTHTYATLDTLAYYLRQPGNVPGATMTLYDNGSFSENLTATGPDSVMQKYVGSGSPQQGHTYMLKVEAPGYKPITSTYTQPLPVSIGNVEIRTTEARYYNFNSEGNQGQASYQFDIDIEFTDVTGDNYYEFALIQSSDPDLKAAAYVSSAYLYSRKANEQMNRKTRGGSMINDKAFSEQKINLPLAAYLTSFTHDDTLDLPYVTIELRSLSKEYYDFKTYLAISNSNDPYAQPALMKTNVEGGLGLFAGYSASRYTFKLEIPSD